MAKTDFKFSTRLRVRWSECDAQGIVYYGAYMDYLDVAQSEYFRKLGLRTHDPKVRQFFDTITVKATLEYRTPARLDELLDIHMRVAHIGTSSLATSYEIYGVDADALVLEAEVVAVNYDIEAGAKRRVPDGLRAAIEEFESSGVVLSLRSYPDLAGLAFD